MTRRPLAELLPAVADVLGVPAFTDRGAWLGPWIPGVRHVVVLLVDGLGDDQLRAHPELTPVLTERMVDLGGLAAPFPSTTPVSLTSFGTGLPPGQHGIVSASFRLEDGSSLTPLWWPPEPNPIATQPEPTVFERAEGAGVLVTTAAPGEHSASGLTRAALRGGAYQGVASISDRMVVAHDAVLRARQAGRPSLTYVYWPDLDKAGSRAWRGLGPLPLGPAAGGRAGGHAGRCAARSGRRPARHRRPWAGRRGRRVPDRPGVRPGAPGRSRSRSWGSRANARSTAGPARPRRSRPAGRACWGTGRRCCCASRWTTCSVRWTSGMSTGSATWSRSRPSSGLWCPTGSTGWSPRCAGSTAGSRPRRSTCRCGWPSGQRKA